MRLKLIVGSLLMIMILAACAKDTPNLDNHGQEDISIKELVEDYSVGNIEGQSASITGTELIVTTEDNSELIYDLPKDEFFVSIAPFISQTHECTVHSLTGCQGEIIHQNMDVYIEDMNGDIIVDEQMNSRANGFLDLWLPRDQTFNVKITFDGKQTESEISTFKNDGTCITTMQLL